MARLCIQIVGAKKTGKTTLLEKVTRELARRGRSVCYVKHRHEEARIDASDTDTSRLIEAGASAAVLVGDSSTFAFRRSADGSLARITLGYSLPGEIVLVEGFKSLPGRKIAMAGGDLDISALEGVLAVVGDPPDGFEGPVIAPDDIESLCDLIEKTIDSGRGDIWETSLVLDGREVRLNSFVQDIMASGLLGMASVLDGVESADTLEVRCIRKQRD